MTETEFFDMSCAWTYKHTQNCQYLSWWAS